MSLDRERLRELGDFVTAPLQQWPMPPHEALRLTLEHIEAQAQRIARLRGALVSTQDTLLHKVHRTAVVKEQLAINRAALTDDTPPEGGRAMSDECNVRGTAKLIVTSLGEFREVNPDPLIPFVDRYTFVCPGCGQEAYLDEDQWEGRVSVDHTSMGCRGNYHETHQYAVVLQAALAPNSPADSVEEEQ